MDFSSCLLYRVSDGLLSFHSYLYSFYLVCNLYRYLTYYRFSPINKLWKRLTHQNLYFFILIYFFSVRCYWWKSIRFWRVLINYYNFPPYRFNTKIPAICIICSGFAHVLSNPLGTIFTCMFWNICNNLITFIKT